MPRAGTDRDRGDTVEFGIFVQMFMPGANAHDPVAEHRQAMNELEMIRVADQHNWKYVWVSEHHCPHRVLAPVGQRVVHPVLARADRADPRRLGHLAAQPDHEPSGAARRAGRDVRPALRGPLRVRFAAAAPARWEVGTFNLDTAETKEIWDEVIWEFKKMWASQRLLPRRQGVPDAAAQHPPEAVRRRAHPPADVGGRGQPADLREGGPPRARRARLQRRRASTT